MTEAPRDDPRPPTLGEVIDRLGVTMPDNGRSLSTVTKALVITLGTNPRVPEATRVTGCFSGGLTVIEAVGLVETVRRDLLSESRQAEAMKIALTRP